MADVVHDMADAFESGISADGLFITVEAADILHNLFSEVPLLLRGPVFRAFLEELEDRQIPYSIEAMNTIGNA